MPVSSQEFRDGCTFFYGPTPSSLHLHVVLFGTTGPPTNAIVVSLTTANDLSDPTLLLDVGDHPFLSRKTCVDYRFLTQMTYSVLVERESANVAIPLPMKTFRRDEDVSPGLLNSMRSGALQSRYVAKWMKAEVRRRLGIG